MNQTYYHVVFVIKNEVRRKIDIVTIYGRPGPLYSWLTAGPGNAARREKRPACFCPLAVSQVLSQNLRHWQKQATPHLTRTPFSSQPLLASAPLLLSLQAETMIIRISAI